MTWRSKRGRDVEEIPNVEAKHWASLKISAAFVREALLIHGEQSNATSHIQAARPIAAL